MKSVEQKYRKLSDVEHVLIRPGRYIGAVDPHVAQAWVVKADKTGFEQRELTWNPGFLKLFDEIISNSVDHSKTVEGKHLDTIKVEIDRETGEISVADNGGIPVVVHKEYDEHVPTVIFGYLRSGENFDDTEDSTKTGQNGEGASLTNIFSTKFTVETCDGQRKFKQTWEKNMTAPGKPIVSSGFHKGTKITYAPDYPRLKMPQGLDDDNHAKLVKRVYDVAGCNPGLKVYLNGELIKIKNFSTYIGMYTSEFEYDETDDWQVGVAKSEDGFKHQSFVNSTETSLGGTHVYYVWSQIAGHLREYIQKKFKVELKPSEIQNHLWIFINARIIRPRYSSQTKEDLITEVKEYKTKWSPSEKFIKSIIKSPVIEQIMIWVEAKARAEELKALRELNKSVEKDNYRRVDKFFDASDKNRHLCELYLTEGDSASKGIQNSAGKNPLIGSFPLKGKPLNITDCATEDILENNEIKNIMLITGLKIGQPVKSNKDLRFGKIVIMSDQDLDGFHVSSLLFNFFSHFWPELFRLGMIYRIHTPLVIAKMKGGVEKEFLTDEAYETWAKEGHKHEAKRFKGLGTFTPSQFEKVINNREKYLVRVKEVTHSDEEGLSLAFNGARADDRKEWLNGINYFHKFE